MSNHYEVESIVAKRRQNGVDKYLVKWRGFSSTLNTWEPEEHFTDMEMIEEFNKKLTLLNQSSERQNGKATPSAKNANSISQRFNGNKLRRPLQNGQVSDESHSPQSKLGNSLTSPKKRQSYEITAPDMQIQGIYVDPQGKFWFNINNNGNRTTVSHEQAISMNFKAIISYYEKNIKFYTK